MIKERIQLAGLIGWTHLEVWNKTEVYGIPPNTTSYEGGMWSEMCLQAPNPFEDANDDYACLEWMRDKYDSQIVINALESLNNNHCDMYEKGDFARAALEVINET